MFTPLGLGLLFALWRYVDGSDNRPKGSNILGIAIVLCAALYSAWPIDATTHALSYSLLLPALVTSWLATRGMPGWTEWKPMLLGFAVPTLLVGLLYGVMNGFALTLLPFLCSGLLVCSTYVLGSSLEVRYPSWFGSFTAEKWGRLSYGFLVGGLALL
jgi:hypothetical protein